MGHYSKLMLDELLRAHEDGRTIPFTVNIPQSPITVVIGDRADLILNIAAFRQLVQQDTAAEALGVHGMVTR